MFTDEQRRTVWEETRQHDLRTFEKWLSPDVLLQAAGDAGLRSGRGPRHIANLAWLAIAAALHTSKSFADVLGLALKLLSDTEGFASTPPCEPYNHLDRFFSVALYLESMKIP